MSTLAEPYKKKGFPENRSKLEIINSILAASEEGTLKTRIMYKCNLNSRQIDSYLNLLLRGELIERTPDERGTRYTYRPTERGLRFLDTYGELLEILGKYEE